LDRRLNLRRIYAAVFEFNIASMKVLEKNGYLNEGILKKAVFKNGEVWDEHRFYRCNI
jgi:RimJ/RimL family protein N-acetyltransferase